MRIEKNLLICFLSIIAVLCLVFLSPAFADFQKVSDRELARANASLEGQPSTEKYPTNDDELDAASNYFENYITMLIEEQPFPFSFSSIQLHNDYGYDWLKNPKAIGDPYYAEPASLSALTVLAGSCFGLGLCGENSIYVRIGFKGVESDFSSKDFNVTLGSEATSRAGRDQTLGTLYLQGTKLKFDDNYPSYVTMCMAEGKTVINTDVDVKIYSIDIATLSWGDADGCRHNGVDNTGNAGYVGLKDTSITGVTAKGSANLDIAHVDLAYFNIQNQNQELGLTNVINVTIPDMSVGIESLDTTVVLGDKKDFSGIKYVLGTLYMKDLTMNVTGSYVNIFPDPVTYAQTDISLGLNIPSLTLNTLSWGDSDGFTGGTSAGFVGLRNLSISNLAITGLATMTTMTAQVNDSVLPSGTVFVRLGLSKFGIKMDSLDTQVALGNKKDNLDQVLGSIYLGKLDMNIYGNVDIHTPSATTQGVVLELGNKDPITMKEKPLTINVSIGALSWGDGDGSGGGISNAGYRGWRNMNITGLSLAGTISLEVATVDASKVPVSTDAQMFANYSDKTLSPSFVHIGIGTGNANDNPALPGAVAIGIDKMSWNVVVDTSKSLDSSNAGVLRSFYMSGMEIRTNGWVHIGAH